MDLIASHFIKAAVSCIVYDSPRLIPCMESERANFVSKNVGMAMKHARYGPPLLLSHTIDVDAVLFWQSMVCLIEDTIDVDAVFFWQSMICLIEDTSDVDAVFFCSPWFV